MTQDMQTALLTTVNAPYQNRLDAGGLAAALKSENSALGQVSSFFTETDIVTQKAFAHEYGISDEILTRVAGVLNSRTICLQTTQIAVCIEGMIRIYSYSVGDFRRPTIKGTVS